MSQTDDSLLRALAELEREEYERPYPQAWEDVLAGRATPAQAAEARAGVDPPDQHAAYQAAFTGPIARAELDAVVDRLIARPREAEVLRPRFGRGVIVGIAAVLAVAAALVLWQLPREGPRGQLVAYGLTVRSTGLQTKRGAEEEPHRYRPTSQIDWVLSPELAVTNAVELRVLASDGAAVRLLAPAVTRLPGGVLRLRGEFAQVLGLPPGVWQLRFIVSPGGTAPVDAAAAEAALASGLAVEVGERVALTALPAA